jgi:hypothetical protein
MAYGPRNDFATGFDMTSGIGDGIIAGKRQQQMDQRQAQLDKVNAARQALEDSALAQSMKERQMRMDLMGNKAEGDPEAERYKKIRNDLLQNQLDTQTTPVAPISPPTDNIDPADEIAVGLTASAAGTPSAPGTAGSTGSKKNPVSDVMGDVLTNYKLIQAGGLAAKESTGLSKQLADLDAQLAQTPSTDPNRAALSQQREGIAAKVEKLVGMQQAISLTGSERLQRQLPKNKDGSVNWGIMTDAQKTMAKAVGIAPPPPPVPDASTDPIGAALVAKQGELGQTIADNPTNAASLLDYVPFIGGRQAKRKQLEADISSLQQQRAPAFQAQVPGASLVPMTSLAAPAPTAPTIDPETQKAMAWATANPNDPRAAAIQQRAAKLYPNASGGN